jgi:N-methylhydantoinase B
VVQVVTTGGGGWGDPLERETELILRDVVEGRVSIASAGTDYGVVFAKDSTAEHPRIDQAATLLRRGDLRKARKGALPMIDRGDGYEKMLRGEHLPRMR